MKNYIVYMYVCPNNKRYIGITSMKFNKRRNAGYNEYLTNAIKEYTWENIEQKILYENLTKEEAEQKEIELISFYKSNEREYDYNIANGGHVHCVSNETKLKISKNNAKYWKNKKLDIKTKNKIREKMLGRHHSEETKIKISKNHARHNLGKHLSEYQKQRISEVHKGMKVSEKTKQKRKLTYQKKYPNGFHHTEEAILKMKKAKIGHLVSEETKEKIRQANLGKHFTDEHRLKLSKNNAKYWKGKHLSEETRKKMSKSVICIETKTTYYSSVEVERQTGINRVCINLCCNNKLKTAGKLHWKFYEEQ